MEACMRFELKVLFAFVAAACSNRRRFLLTLGYLFFPSIFFNFDFDVLCVLWLFFFLPPPPPHNDWLNKFDVPLVVFHVLFGFFLVVCLFF